MKRIVNFDPTNPKTKKRFELIRNIALRQAGDGKGERDRATLRKEARLFDAFDTISEPDSVNDKDRQLLPGGGTIELSHEDHRLMQDYLDKAKWSPDYAREAVDVQDWWEDAERRDVWIMGLLGGFSPSGFSPSGFAVATINFSEFLAWPERHDVVLAILEPAELMLEWTVDGTYATVFSTPFVNRVGTEDLPGGFYRYLVSVTQGHGEAVVSYSQVASKASCDALVSSYFYDETNGVLYVHTSDGMNPATKDAMLAYFNLYFATEPVTLLVNNQPTPFAPLLEERSGITVTQDDEDPLFGVKKIVQGDVNILNVNGVFSRMYARYFWKNKKARMFFGGSYNNITLDFSDYYNLSTMLITDIAAGEDVTFFKLVSQTSILQKEIPVTEYDDVTYPDADSSVIGSRKPVWYGKTTVRPDLIDTSGNGIYLLADPLYQTMFAVDAVRAVSKTTGQTTGLAGSDYIVSLSACTVTITNATYTHLNYIIEVTATGKPDGLGSYIKTWAAIVNDILRTFCKQTDADIDLTSLTNAAAQAPAELFLFQKEPRQLLSIFQSGGTEPCLERSVMSRLDTTDNGKWYFRVTTEPISGTESLLTLRQTDFVKFEPMPKLGSIFFKVVVTYDFDYSRGSWKTVTAVSNRTRYANQTEDVIFVYTNLKNVGDATVLAQRYRYMWSVIPLEIDCEEVGHLTLDSRVGDLVSVYYKPAPNIAKEFLGDRFVITRMVHAFTKPPKMSFVLSNLRAAPGNIGTWSADGTPTWAATPASQRLSHGYWCNASGRADPADLASENVSLWW